MTIHYEDLLSELRGILAADAPFVALGIPVHVGMIDVTGPTLTAASDALLSDLEKKGLVAILDLHASVVGDFSGSKVICRAAVSVTLVESPEVNRVAPGLQVMPATAIAVMVRAILGKPGRAGGWNYGVPTKGNLIDHYAKEPATSRWFYPLHFEINCTF